MASVPGAAPGKQPGWLELASSQLGKPYIWGSAGGRSNFSWDAPGYDCSGFVAQVYRNAFGVNLPAFTGSAYPQTKAVASSEAQPGDLVFWNMGIPDPRRQHVGIYIGNGKVIQSGGQGDGVNIAPVTQMAGAEFRRSPAAFAKYSAAPDPQRVSSGRPDQPGSVWLQGTVAPAVGAAAGAVGRAAGLVWPILGARPGANITNPFGARQTKAPGYEQVVQSDVNHGLDIGARQGTPVVAPAAGTVVSVGTGTNSGWGNSVLLRDAAGNQHRLSHLRDVPLVKAGQRLEAGQRLGYVGSTGNSTGPHLDYEYKPAVGGFANPLSQEFTMASDQPPGGTAETGTLTPGAGTSGAPGTGPGAGGPGGPGGDDDRNKPVAERIRDALARNRAAQEAAKYPEDQAKLQATEQALLRDLAALEGGTTSETDAEKALREAQAGYYSTRAGQEEADRAQRAAQAAAQNASAEAIAAARNATDLTQTGMTTGASRYGAELAAGTSRYGTDVDAATQRYGYDLSAAQAAANLTWDQEKARILQAFNEKKFGWEQAVAAATEAKQRLELELTQQRNAIEAAGLDVTQRGQDLSSQVTQRGQDLEAQTTVRGQDVGRLNQAVSSGASLLGNAMSTAGQIGANTGQTALGALRYYAPANAGEAFNRAGQGQAPNLGTVGMPFDPTTIVQQAADAAYARYAPPGQALLAQGMGPSPAFVAPGAIAAPARVGSGYAPVQLPPNVLQPGAGGQFVAP